MDEIKKNKLEEEANTQIIEDVGKPYEDERKLIVRRLNISGSQFTDLVARDLFFEDIDLRGLKITNANMSDIEIDGAQIGGAFIHNIGLPPGIHDPDAKQRPVTFENCDLNNSTMTDCNLSNFEIINCMLSGMKIDGIPVEDLLEQYRKSKRSEE